MLETRFLRRRPGKTRLWILMGLFITIGGIITYLENLFLPPAGPLRLGLGNAVTLIALYMHGFAPALGVNLERIALGGILSGQLFGPGFIIGVSGAIAATVIMGLLYRRVSIISIFGVSWAGAVVFNFTALAVISALIAGGAAMMYMTPLLWIMALAGGAASALIAHLVLRNLSGATVYSLES